MKKRCKLVSYIQKFVRAAGYPLVSYSNYYDGLAPFLRFQINNVGDPFISGNLAIHSRKFEVEVLDWFAKLWEIQGADDEYWGYITNGGTEGNFHGLLIGLEIFQLDTFTFDDFNEEIITTKIHTCMHAGERDFHVGFYTHQRNRIIPSLKQREY